MNLELNYKENKYRFGKIESDRMEILERKKKHTKHYFKKQTTHRCLEKVSQHELTEHDLKKILLTKNVKISTNLEIWMQESTYSVWNQDFTED